MKATAAAAAATSNQQIIIREKKITNVKKEEYAHTHTHGPWLWKYARAKCMWPLEAYVRAMKPMLRSMGFLLLLLFLLPRRYTQYTQDSERTM